MRLPSPFFDKKQKLEERQNGKHCEIRGNQADATPQQIALYTFCMTCQALYCHIMHTLSNI